MQTRTKNRSHNTEALCILDSNLTACKIPHLIVSSSVSGKEGYDILVRNAGPKDVYAKVAVLVDPAPTPGADISVLVETVLNLDRAVSLSAFHAITEQLGWGKPIPVDRGPAPEGKTKDVDLLVVRHCEYRQAPDLPAHILRWIYEPTIRRIARKILRNPARAEVIFNAGEDFDSLVDIGRIIAHNFHHRYRNLRLSADDNARFFAQHLDQRYGNSISQWRKRQNNVMPDEQTLAISQPDEKSIQPYEQPENYSALIALTVKEQRTLSNRLRKVRANILAERQKQENSRQKSIDDYLVTMRHDQRLTILGEYADRDARFIDPEVKAFAVKKLAAERERCDNGCCEAYKLDNVLPEMNHAERIAHLTNLADSNFAEVKAVASKHLNAERASCKDEGCCMVDPSGALHDTA